MSKSSLRFVVGLLISLATYAGDGHVASRVWGFGPLWSQALLVLGVLWLVLPFILFRLNPCSLVKVSIETRRMNKRLHATEARWGTASCEMG